MSMDRPRRNEHGAHARQVLALLAILLGLLAMHGLASSHHGPAAAAAEHTDAGSPSHDAAGTTDHDAADAALSAESSTGSPASPAGPSCDGDCPSAFLTLCVAVLAAAAALAAAVVLLRRRPYRRAIAAGAPTSSMPADARDDVPPPDPVRELCVSRT